MFKSLRIFLVATLAAILLPACTKKQNPTPVDTEFGTNSSWDGSGKSTTNRYAGNIVPDGGLPSGGGDFSTDYSSSNLNNGGDSGISGLEQRNDPNGNAFDQTGFFNGKQMFRDELNSIYFGFDSSAISQSERSKLQVAADYLLENPSESLLIEGHADWYGTADYNLALGERRAASARDYLVTLGVSQGRIETLSKGSLEATPGLSKDQSSSDRRAELIVLKQP